MNACVYAKQKINMALTEFFNNCCQTHNLGRAFILIEHNSSEANGQIIHYHEVLAARLIKRTVVMLQKNVTELS